MDKKIMTIALVVAVIAILGGMLYAMHKDDGKCDYTLLDSSDNVKAGFTAEFESTDHNGTLHSKRVVEKVEDGYAYNTLFYDVNNIESVIEKDRFLPENYAFDYTSDDLPEGIDVEQVGSVYKITGSTEGYHTTYIYELSIFYADGKVYNVQGTLKEHYSTDTADEYGVITYETKNEGVFEYFSYTGWEEWRWSVDTYMEKLGPFDPDSYPGATVEDGRYGGVDVEIYTFNGEKSEIEYKDYKIYVYNGHALKMNGTIIDNGIEYKQNWEMKIYQD